MARKVNLIVDSGCDLPTEILTAHGAYLLHFSYVDTTDVGLTGTDDLFSTMPAHEFYDKMRAGACPQTSQPAQGEMEQVFAEATAEGIPAVYLAFSSGISGCFEGAVAARRRLVEAGLDERLLQIVDTRLASTPLVLLVEAALQKVEAGVDAAELVAWATRERFFVQTIFMVDDLDTLHRGGRIPRSVATVGSKLKVKPLLSFDREGKLTVIGAGRGRKKAITKMGDYIIEYHDEDAHDLVVSIGNADSDPKDVERLKQQITQAVGPVRFLETSVGPVCGCHVGAGTLACGFWGNGPRTAE